MHWKGAGHPQTPRGDANPSALSNLVGFVGWGRVLVVFCGRLQAWQQRRGSYELLGNAGWILFLPYAYAAMLKRPKTLLERVGLSCSCSLGHFQSHSIDLQGQSCCPRWIFCNTISKTALVLCVKQFQVSGATNLTIDHNIDSSPVAASSGHLSSCPVIPVTQQHHHLLQVETAVHNRFSLKPSFDTSEFGIRTTDVG